MTYQVSANFDSLVASIETAVAAVDYRAICDTLVAYASQCGYTGRPFNRDYNTNAKGRWCKAEASDGRLQYVLAGLGKDSDRGRLDVLKQWDYLCNKNVANQKALRSINPATIEAGVMRSFPKQDSVWGSVEARQAGHIVSINDSMSGKERIKAVALVEKVDNAKTVADRLQFNGSMSELANIITASEQRQAKKAKAPAVTKQEQTPNVTKTGRKAKGGTKA